MGRIVVATWEDSESLIAMDRQIWSTQTVAHILARSSFNRTMNSLESHFSATASLIRDQESSDSQSCETLTLPLFLSLLERLMQLRVQHQHHHPQSLLVNSLSIKLRTWVMTLFWSKLGLQLQVCKVVEILTTWESGKYPIVDGDRTIKTFLA